MNKETSQFRLFNYDYSQNGAYFVTVCVDKREQILSNIIDDFVEYSDIGNILNEIILLTNQQYNDISINKYVIMPDHFHLIVVIGNDTINEGNIYQISFDDNFVPQNIGESSIPNNPMEINRVTLGKYINWLKGRTTFEVRKGLKLQDFKWQPRFNDRIIRNQKELEAYQNYIENNPANWDVGV